MSEGPDLSVVYSGVVDEVLSAADRSRGPMSLDVIYDLAQEAGFDAATLVVDVGCATGSRSRELIRRTGCRVTGVELLPQLIEWGTAETIEAGLADRLSIQQGSILDLPLPDAYADAVLCTDVLGLIEDLPRAVSECARVLKPDGAMISYVTVATDRMAAFEQAELDASQGTVAASMDRMALERVFGEHFTIERAVALGKPAPPTRHRTRRRRDPDQPAPRRQTDDLARRLPRQARRPGIPNSVDRSAVGRLPAP